jgi:hypothetical protein
MTGIACNEFLDSNCGRHEAPREAKVGGQLVEQRPEHAIPAVFACGECA